MLGKGGRRSSLGGRRGSLGGVDGRRRKPNNAPHAREH
jgi:hypothetical protein